jgi:hypothetical protein
MITREARRRGQVVTFTLLTEEPVSVVGDFNGWDPHAHPLPLRDDGKRSTTIELEPGRYAFRYLAEGGRFFDDPEADFLESNGMGDSHGVLEVGADDVAADEGSSANGGTAVPVASVEQTIAAGPALAAATPAHGARSIASASPEKAKAPKAKAPKSKAAKAPEGAPGDDLERIEPRAHRGHRPQDRRRAARRRPQHVRPTGDGVRRRAARGAGCRAAAVRAQPRDVGRAGRAPRGR